MTGDYERHRQVKAEREIKAILSHTVELLEKKQPNVRGKQK